MHRIQMLHYRDSSIASLARNDMREGVIPIHDPNIRPRLPRFARMGRICYIATALAITNPCDWVELISCQFGEVGELR
jgi:hypothetical protein